MVRRNLGYGRRGRSILDGREAKEFSLILSLPIARQHRAISPPCLGARMVSWFAIAMLCATAVLAQQSRGERLRAFVDDRQASETYVDVWERGEYRQALQMLEDELEELAPAVPSQMRYHRAQLRFATGQVDEAIEDMRVMADRQPQPAYSLELALMFRYRGMPLLYEKWLQRAAGQTRGSSWYYRNRSENVAAVGRIAELLGSNPKTILSAHYGQMFEVFPDLGAVVYVGAGDLAYRNSGYDVAEEYYLKALEKEPNHQEALAGLMECYWKSHDERLQEVLKQLEDQNPNHPRLDAVKVERLLEDYEPQKALEIIEKQLAINPVSHRFRSLKAAALFLVDDLDGMNEVIENVLAYSPVRSEIYRTIGRFASRHYRFKEGVQFQAKALELDAEDYQARALYTLDLMRLGRELEGREELEKAFEQDPYNVQLYNLLQLMDTLETFSTVRRGAFVLRLPPTEEPILAEAALDLLDEALVYLEDKYQIDVEKPILIEMFDNHDDFMVRSVGLPGNAGHLGICFGKLVTMDAPSVRPKGSSNWRSVLWHEFTHVISLQKTHNRMPRWLSEGISVYEEEQRAEAWENRLDPNFLPILREEGIPGLKSIDGYFTSPKSGMHLMYGYFIAGEFIKFFSERYGFQTLVDALEAIGEGERAEDALVAQAGVSFETLDDDFLAYLLERFEPFENLPQPKGEDEKGFLEKLAQRIVGGGGQQPPGQNQAVPNSPFTDAMQEAEEAAQQQQWDKAEAAWKRAYELFPDYAGQDAPLRRLAKLYEIQGREEDYQETLEKLRLATPQELDATIELTRLYQEDGEWARVAETADWALGIDPYDPWLYRTRVEALVETERSPDALDALAVLTHLDSGKAIQYRLQRAQILRDIEEWDPAKREVLRLLEEMPHYWDAQRLLLDIVDRGAENEPIEVSEAPKEDAATSVP